MSPIFRRPEPTAVPRSGTESATEFCDRLIAGFAEKAHHNKRESLVLFWIVLIGTLAAPLFIAFGDMITVGDPEIWTRVVPATLSVIAGGSTAWLQLRKPQQLWALYRDAQRQLEDSRSRHAFRIGDFALEGRDQTLAERVADVALSVHNRWMPMIPTPEGLSGITARGPAHPEREQQ